jgi:lysophospholipid acyltransferase
MEALEAPLRPIAGYLGLPIDIFKALFAVLACVPAGWVQCMFITNETAGLVYSLVVGLSLAVLQYDFSGLYIFFTTSVLVYLMLLFVRRDRLGLSVTCVSFAALSYMHIDRMWNDWMGWKMDASGLQMMATLKFISLAYCYQDSLLLRTDPSKVPLHTRSLSVETVPSLLEYYSYLCMYAGFCLGPFCEYKTFSNYIKRKSVYAHLPSPVLPSLVRLSQGLLLLSAYILTSSYFDPFYFTTEQAAGRSLLYKSAYLVGLYVCVEGKYFGGWKLSEAAIIASGLGYSGRDWDQCLSIEVWPMWSSSDLKSMIDKWNISVTMWLRKYVYFRVLAVYPHNRALAQISVLMTSAFWHGFYPAYYIFYVNIFFLNDLIRLVQERALQVPKALRVLAALAMHYVILYNGLAFLTLGFYEAIQSYAAFYYIPLVSMYGLWGYFSMTRKRAKGSKSL